METSFGYRRDRGRASSVEVLLNNLVLTKIAVHFTPRELLRLRPTATAWNQAFVPRLRRIHRPIKLTMMSEDDKNALDVFPGIYRPVKEKAVKEYVELMKSSGLIPFGRYELPVVVTKPEHQQHFEELFELCGHTIFSLKCGWDARILEGSNLTMMDIRKMVFELSPNLNELELDLRGLRLPHGSRLAAVAGTEEMGMVRASMTPAPVLKRVKLNLANDVLQLPVFQVILHDVFGIVMGLEELELANTTQDGHGNVAALNMMCEARPQLGQLKIFKIIEPTLAEFQILTELSLHLSDFSTLFGYDNSANPDHLQNAEALHYFLVTQAETARLRRLSIYFSGRHDRGLGVVEQMLANRLPIRIPRIEACTTLCLLGVGQLELHFEGATLGSAFPNLQRLELSWNLVQVVRPVHDDREDQSVVIQLNQLEHPNVTDLVITVEALGFWQWNWRSDELLARLATHLPAVTRFEAFIPGFSLPQCIWTCWSDLAELHLEHLLPQGTCMKEIGIVMDEWLSGISFNTSEEIEDQPSYQIVKLRTNADGHRQSLPMLRYLLAKHKTRPGITDLHSLRRLALRVMRVMTSPSYGEDENEELCVDIGGYFGLALCNPTLEHLSIKIQAPTLQEFLTPECKSLIRYVLGPHARIELNDE